MPCVRRTVYTPAVSAIAGTRRDRHREIFWAGDTVRAHPLASSAHHVRRRLALLIHHYFHLAIPATSPWVGSAASGRAVTVRNCF